MTRTRRSSRGAPHVRLRAALVAITLVLSVFGARLAQIQGIDAASYAERAGTSGIVNVSLPAERGRILDRDGEPLAESVEGMMLVADPQTTRSRAAEIAQVLADRLDLDYFTMLERLQRPDTRFVYLARRVPSTLATGVIEDLRSQQIAGVDTRPDPLRSYPAGDVAGNLIGFIGDDGEPLSGLEQTYDRLLAGQDGEEVYEVGGGNRIPLGERTRVDPVDGRDLRLTIDRDVQWFSQRALCSATERFGAEWGAAVVMDTESGELLALADCPTFSPEQPGRTETEDRGSRAVTDLFEPGSVSKVLTFAGLLDAGLISPETELTVPDSLEILDRNIGDYWDHGTLQLTAAGALALSSNVGTTLAAEEMEPEALRDYLVGFGLTEPTALGIAAEARGSVPSLDGWSVLTQSQVSFGQGLSANAVQMTAAVNAVANQGLRVSPSLLVGRHTDGLGVEVGTETTEVQRVVSPEAADATARMMELVTTEEVGTAPNAAIPGYRVAGKTGTAQQAGGDCNCYAGGHKAVSFGGFAPADDARFTVYVVVSNPTNGGSGTGTAAPVFRQIMNYVLQRYAVPPTGQVDPPYPAEWGDGGDEVDPDEAAAEDGSVDSAVTDADR